MRTTVDIPDRLRAALHATAASRGLRGFSKLVEEALDLYFHTLAKQDDAIVDVLALSGTWSDDEAATTRTAISELRTTWISEDVP